MAWPKTILNCVTFALSARSWRWFLITLHPRQPFLIAEWKFRSSFFFFPFSTSPFHIFAHKKSINAGNELFPLPSLFSHPLKSMPIESTRMGKKKSEGEMSNNRNVLIQFAKQKRRRKKSSKKEEKKSSSRTCHKRLNSSPVAVYCLVSFHLLN